MEEKVDHHGRRFQRFCCKDQHQRCNFFLSVIPHLFQSRRETRQRKSFLETGIVLTLFIPLLKLIKLFQVYLLATTLSSTEFDWNRFIEHEFDKMNNEWLTMFTELAKLTTRKTQSISRSNNDTHCCPLLFNESESFESSEIEMDEK
jgi:hypothetical protein